MSPRLLRGSVLCLQLRQGNTVELPEEENTPEKRVDRIFAMMDKVRRHTGTLDPARLCHWSLGLAQASQLTASSHAGVLVSFPGSFQEVPCN